MAGEERKVEVNKSALISLKAELLRKQGEVSSAKQDARNQMENFKPTSKFSKENDENEGDKIKSNEPNIEDFEALRKSKEALEKKSLIYEHLSQSTSTSHNTEHYLVQFDKKQKENLEKDDDVLKNFSDDDSDDEWVDYVDCLGRTRRCHKSDLEHIKRRDERLKDSIGPSKPEENIATKSWVKEGEAQELESPDAYKEQLRKQWEGKEQELLTKESIHYEDVLFNEARQHGVGYYALSSQGAERAKQQAELKATRTETEKAQNSVAEARKKREDALQARVKAARARQRARAGLPPEEEPKQSVTAKLLDFIEEQKRTSATKAAEEARKKREEKEEEARKEREKIVREWDLGKEDLQTKGSFVQMTQEQWVQKKRGERITEFGPTEDLERSQSNKPKDSKKFDNKGYFIDTEGNLPSTSRGGKKREYYDLTVNKPNTSFESVKIRNECSDSEDEEISRTDNKYQNQAASIPPPSTYEYCGPSDKQYKPNEGVAANVGEAFEQGLKYLEKKKSKQKHHPQ